MMSSVIIAALFFVLVCFASFALKHQERKRRRQLMEMDDDEILGRYQKEKRRHWKGHGHCMEPSAAYRLHFHEFRAKRKLMLKGLWIIIVLLASLIPGVAELPPDVQAEKYLKQAILLKEKKDYTAAVDMMDMIARLQKEKRIELPEEFYFRYAQIALAADRVGTALISVNKYLSKYGDKGTFYQEALALCIQIERHSLPLNPEKASLVRPVIGWGVTRLIDDFVDFKTEGGRILIENDSKWRSQLMTGGLIKLHEFKNKSTIDIAANLEFAVGGKYVDGFFFGGGFGIPQKLEFIIGYSLGRGTELSHGFRQAMGHFIKKHKRDRRFPEFEGVDLVDGVVADLKDYDGLPISYINHRGEEERIFPGDAIIDSFNSKWSFGVLIRLDIWKEIKAAVKNAK